jgi:hypothetical protein
MPDQSSAAREHALLQEITEPLAAMPDDSVPIAADVDFPHVLRGYDRLAVDAYVRKTSQLVAELQARASPQAAIKRALERVGEDVSGILQRAHDTAEQITSQSRREGEDRLEAARQEAGRITADAERRVKELDVDTDRIWAERDRIVADTRELARQLVDLAEVAAARFPPAEESDPAAGEPTAVLRSVSTNGHGAGSPEREIEAEYPDSVPDDGDRPLDTQPMPTFGSELEHPEVEFDGPERQHEPGADRDA